MIGPFTDICLKLTYKFCFQVIAGVIATGFHVVLGFSFAFSGIMIPDLIRNVTNNETDSGEILATKTESAWAGKILKHL